MTAGKKTVQVTFRVPAELLKRLDSIAEGGYMTRGVYLRTLISQDVRRYEKEYGAIEVQE